MMCGYVMIDVHANAIFVIQCLCYSASLNETIAPFQPNTHTHTYIYTHINTHIYTQTHIYTHINTHTYTQTYTYTCTYTHTHTSIHTYTHTGLQYTQACLVSQTWVAAFLTEW